MRWVHPHLYDQYLDAIDRTLIDKIIETRRADGVANATVNRVIEVVKAILRKAAWEWEWIDRVPSIANNLDDGGDALPLR